MIAAIKDWLPITVRNRVALGFMFLGLVMFVSWNLLPAHFTQGEFSETRVFQEIWSFVFSPDLYLAAVKSPSIDRFIGIIACIVLMQNGLVLIFGIPFWKIYHASNCITVPFAVVNLIGGLFLIKILCETWISKSMSQELTLLALVSMSMLAVFFAMLIFRNELGLRHDLEVKKTMAGE